MPNRLRVEVWLTALAILALVAILTPAGRARGGELHQGLFAFRASPDFYSWFGLKTDTFFAIYMAPEGRIVDPENGGISHSESSAYGMALALAANDEVTFDKIWTWTRLTLRRSDGLHAWRYEPGRGVVDTNNATDADLIIAGCLSVAARRWNRGDYLRAAVQTAHSLGAQVLIRHKGHVLMLPARHGFTAPSQPDGPVVNLSYYHFSMMRIVADLDPGHPWPQAIADGVHLYEHVLDHWYPSDWTSLADPENPKPALNFPAQASYDAVRILVNMLSIVWPTGPHLVEKADRIIQHSGDTLWLHDPHAGIRPVPLRGKGYSLIAAAIHCHATNAPIPRRHFDFRPETYYSSALQIGVIYLVYAAHPHCLPF